MKITAPAGYGPVVPLLPSQNALRGLQPGPSQAWAAPLNAAFVNVGEFARATLDYAVAFTTEPAGAGGTIPVAILGFRPNQNLFIGEDGRWLEGVYVPAFVRRHPFCVAPAGPERQPMVCVEEGALVQETRAPLFDEQGKPTAAWAPVLQMVETFESARQQTRTFCEHLVKLGLLVPFDAVATPKVGATRRLTGLLRVEEKKLQDLPRSELRSLIASGQMRAIYAHLLSLENFAKLLDRSVARGE